MVRYLVAGALALALSLPAHAVEPKSKSRRALYERQTAVLDARIRTRGTSASLDVPEVFIPGVPSAERIPRYAARHRSAFEGAARAAARRHGVPEDLFLRLVTQESGWNPKARSHKGAIGLAQLMPGTALRLGVDPHDPHQNLEGGARYLAQQYRTFRSWRLALAAYNAGPHAVEKYDGVPPYRETRGYVRAILGS